MIQQIFLQKDNSLCNLGIRTILDIDRISYSNSENSVFLITKKVKKFSKYNIIFNPLCLDVSKQEVNSKVSLKIPNKPEINLPIKEFYTLNEDNYETMAEFTVNGTKYPAVVKKDNKIICLFDIGKAFIELINEKYYSDRKEKHVLSDSIVEKVYKAIPYSLRMPIYRRYYKNLHKNIKQRKSYITKYPIDSTGYVLMGLVKLLIKEFTPIVRIRYWPNNHKAALILSHDTEPYKSSYTKGINVLLDNLNKNNVKTTLSLVGDYVKYIKKGTLKKAKVYEVISHGLLHDRRFCSVNEKKRLRLVGTSKRLIENKFQTKIIGFRAPAFQKPHDLVEVLEKNNFKIDMSYIDAQREEPNCGYGNSFNLPFYLIKKNKASSVLELPTSAPDCISPYYFGCSMSKTKKLFQKKIDWLLGINGLMNFIVHTPIWGKKDAEKRMYLLNSIIKYVKNKNVWITTPSQVYDWWKKRGNLHVEISKNKIMLVNNNDCEMINIRILYEDKKKANIIKVKKIDANNKIKIK